MFFLTVPSNVYLQNVRKIRAGMNPPPPMAMNKSGPVISSCSYYIDMGEERGGGKETY